FFVVAEGHGGSYGTCTKLNIAFSLDSFSNEQVQSLYLFSRNPQSGTLFYPYKYQGPRLNNGPLEKREYIDKL
ncbi:MAG: hypothetical protein DRG73_07605, partial [Deltaproteobacteria bacterium]